MTTTKTPKTILGIDPGTTIMGYGVIQIIDKNPILKTMGTIKLYKYSNHYQKLGYIFNRTEYLIHEYKPEEIAIEAPFFGKNIQSMLKLGRAQGVAIAAALNLSVPIFEYAPRKIKLSITGSGAASKEQVAGILSAMLGFTKLPDDLDATDGLAVAVCHYFQGKRDVIPSKPGSSSWKDFIANNPDRIK